MAAYRSGLEVYTKSDLPQSWAKGTQDASVGKNPHGMAVTVLNQIIAYFEGKPFNGKTQTKPILISKDNVDDPNLWGNSFR